MLLVKRHRALIALAVSVVLLLAAVLYVLQQTDGYSSSFPIPPAVYLDQAQRIEPGEPAEAVRQKITGASRVSETSGSISFGMEPLQSHGVTFREPRTQWIVVTVDEAQRVLAVHAGEARRFRSIHGHLSFSSF